MVIYVHVCVHVGLDMQDCFTSLLSPVFHSVNPDIFTNPLFKQVLHISALCAEIAGMLM